MRDYIEERAVETAIYMIETKATVRQTAKKFGVSKSTVHKDLTSRLVQVNPRSGGGGAENSGCEQVRAPHPRRHGDEGEVSASEAEVNESEPKKLFPNRPQIGYDRERKLTKTEGIL